jgi:uncharacterized protein (DUF1800 family)
MIEQYREDVHGEWSRPQAAHLLRRMTIGATPEEIDQAVRDGRVQTIDRLLTPWEVSTSRIGHLTSDDVLAEIHPIDTPEYSAFFTEKNLRYVELVQWWLGLMIRGPLSAQERMVLWWHMMMPTSLNGAHFAEHCYDQNTAMRTHAMGNIREMFDEVIHGMAMQIYLSGVENRCHPWFDGTNENLARELLEVFSLGRIGRNGQENYTQSDVVQIARSLSGWRMEQYHVVSDGVDRLFRKRDPLFRQDHWCAGSRSVFGRSGELNSRDIIDVLFTERQADVAYHICYRWYRSFVNNDPDPEFINAMVEELIAKNMDLSALIRTVLNSVHFYDAANRMSVIQTPLLSFVNLVRYVGATYIPDLDDAIARSEDDLVLRLHGLGQCPYYPPNVSGWPHGIDLVTGTAVARQLELRRRLMLGTLAFKDYDGGRSVYGFDIVALGRGYSRSLDRQAIVVGAINDLLGLDGSDADGMVTALSNGLSTSTPQFLREVFARIVTSTRSLFC